MADSNRDRTDAFGISYRPPDSVDAAKQYLERSRVKLRLAEYHWGEFQRLEDELTPEDFFDFEGEPYLAALAHSDGVPIHLSAAFDALACAVAHQHGIANPDKADFDGWNARLASASSSHLGQLIRDTGGDDTFRGLLSYRNLAAHRGVIGEIPGRSSARVDKQQGVSLRLPSWLPPEFPDNPTAPIRPILERHVTWAESRVQELRRLAAQAWGIDEREL